MPNLIIGSRGSRLARWQAEHVKSLLQQLHPDLTIDIEIIKTTGDKLTEASLAQISGRGVFTKEIEEALLDRRIDLAVHSLKDLPTVLADGLHIAAIPEREDVRDALIVHPRLKSDVQTLKDLPPGAGVGTSSLRRAAQLRRMRSDLRILELRGNVETRLRKLDEGQYDAIILATAGLVRLGFAGRITERIPTGTLLPAVGQGALGIETRIEDDRTNFLLEAVNHWPTRQAVEAERAVLRGLGGGCAVPIAAWGRIEISSEDHSQSLTLEAIVAELQGKESIYEVVMGSPFRSEELGETLAQRMLASGAARLLTNSGISPASDESRGQSVSRESALPFVTEPLITPIEPQPRMEITKQNAVVDLRPSPNSGRKESAEPAATLQTPVSAEPASVISHKADAVTALQTDVSSAALQKSPAPLVEPDKKSERLITPSAVSATASSGFATNARLPLQDQQVLVTRAARQSAELTRLLEEAGAEVIACPTIEITSPSNWDAMDQALVNLSSYNWLVFTSYNGVEYFLKRMDETGRARGLLTTLKICAVGRKTAERLLSEGLPVDLMPVKFTADSLVEALIKRYGVTQRLRGSRMLLPASKITRDVLRPAMSKFDVVVDVVEAYQTVLPANSDEIPRMLSLTQANYIIFTSPSTISNLALLLETDQPGGWLSQTRVACIGPVTAEKAREYGLHVHIQPEEHTSKGIVDALVTDAAKLRQIVRRK